MHVQHGLWTKVYKKDHGFCTMVLSPNDEDQLAGNVKNTEVHNKMAVKELLFYRNIAKNGTCRACFQRK